MRGKMTFWLAWAWFGLILVLTLWDWLQTIVTPTAYEDAFAMLGEMFWGLGIAALAFVGALIISRQPRNTVGWLVMIPALVGLLATPMERYLRSLPAIPSEPPALVVFFGWFAFIAWLPMIFSVLFILQFFPTGRPVSPRWRWLVLYGLGLTAFFSVWTLFEKEFDIADTLIIPNPIGSLPSDTFPIRIWVAALALFVLASVASLLLRYRRAGQVERTQIKWLLYACILFAIIYIPWLWLNELPPPAGTIWGALVALSFSAFPAAIAIAILRYNLWDIDVIIRRTLVYAVLTVFLVLIYFGSIVLLQGLFSGVTDQQSPLIIVLSTLLIAALFNPLRHRLQAIIDRRFYRQKYDAQQVLEGFAETAQDETDVTALTAELLNVVQETIQPEGVTLWLNESDRVGAHE